ncbi:MAG: helix-turn-helix domain-containing protein [Bacteroidales bacterium]|nr:helix-turn-helix domain-containing protein [Bacteroidales bacterium]
MTQTEKFLQELIAIKRYTLLSAKSMLTVEDVADLTGLNIRHIYNLTSTKQIPFYRPRGKQIYFDRAEIDAWMKRNRVTPLNESESHAEVFLAKRGGVL